MIMNGVENKRVPLFLQGEQLPVGYFDPPNPYADAPTKKVRLGALVAYARENGKSGWELTKEDVKLFSR